MLCISGVHNMNGSFFLWFLSSTLKDAGGQEQSMVTWRTQPVFPDMFIASVFWDGALVTLVTLDRGGGQRDEF